MIRNVLVIDVQLVIIVHASDPLAVNIIRLICDELIHPTTIISVRFQISHQRFV